MNKNIITKNIVLQVLKIIFMIEICWIIGLVITINIVQLINTIRRRNVVFIVIA